ncbi:PaaI family thioesterase [Sneathiella sp.]|uniref:PaaI family thioesterase n=1 Tax=Sneathiella sp. TaxID=1964365 RepID=UPI00260D54F3|nr:PaaI family thioesterase [Sneathiella sp.]MDF2366337.1 PaaI family thioesterase [Sneathiella sp.]
MTQSPAMKPPPEGFVQSRTRGPFSTHNGPFYHKVEGEQFWHGLYITERHCNSRGRLHGGMMTTFADGLMATAVARANKVAAVTINLNCDICAAADIGDWLEGTARQTGLNDGFAFVEGEAWVGEKIIFSASGVFRLLEGKS